MVDKSYLLEKPPGPPEWKRALDQEVMPVLIDMAGSLEQVVERVAVQARARPILAISIGVALGCLLGLTVPGRRSA